MKNMAEKLSNLEEMDSQVSRHLEPQIDTTTKEPLHFS
jgi:hypothetical protein